MSLPQKTCCIIPGLFIIWRAKAKGILSLPHEADCDEKANNHFREQPFSCMYTCNIGYLNKLIKLMDKELGSNLLFLQF